VAAEFAIKQILPVVSESALVKEPAQKQMKIESFPSYDTTQSIEFQMLSDDSLNVVVNLLGVTLVVLVVFYHYVITRPSGKLPHL